MKQLPTKLLWVDLEMSGLNPNKDVILEIAYIVTDFEWNELESYESGIQHPGSTAKDLLEQNEWFMAQADEYKQALLEVTQSGEIIEKVEDKLLEVIEAHWQDEKVILAGNSIHMDRKFLDAYMPGLADKLHYRMLDVSSWKIVMQGKYGREHQKAETHRALTDIQESIAELREYIDFLGDQS